MQLMFYFTKVDCLNLLLSGEVTSSWYSQFISSFGLIFVGLTVEISWALLGKEEKKANCKKC